MVFHMTRVFSSYFWYQEAVFFFNVFSTRTLTHIWKIMVLISPPIKICFFEIKKILQERWNVLYKKSSLLSSLLITLILAMTTWHKKARKASEYYSTITFCLSCDLQDCNSTTHNWWSCCLLALRFKLFKFIWYNLCGETFWIRWTYIFWWTCKIHAS